MMQLSGTVLCVCGLRKFAVKMSNMVPHPFTSDFFFVCFFFCFLSIKWIRWKRNVLATIPNFFFVFFFFFSFPTN
jgi:hypothetical protein